jgi:hypothetical protein
LWLNSDFFDHLVHKGAKKYIEGCIVPVVVLCALCVLLLMETIPENGLRKSIPKAAAGNCFCAEKRRYHNMAITSEISMAFK